jgi:nucleoid-associated protein YgaU
MRKDVQFGLTIGGSLVAILIIWVALFDHRGLTKQSDVAVAPTTAPSDQTAVSTDSSQAIPPTTPAATTQPAVATDMSSSTARDWSALLNTGSGGAATQPTMLSAVSTPVDVSDASGANAGQAPATQPTVAAAGTSRTHKVAAGESFYTIAAAVYGSSKYFNRIEDANPNVSPNRLRVGTVLNIPDIGKTATEAAEGTSALTAIPAAAEQPQPAVLDASRTYRVQASDTLMGIARKLYGNGQAWEKIYDANRDAIGPNPARLKVNMVLRLPEAPATTVAN